MLVTRSYRPLSRWWLACTVPLFLLICAPWFIVVSVRNPDFPRFFFIHEHLDRFLTDVHQRVEPWWYFIPCLALAAIPWMRSVVQSVSAVSISTLRSPRHSATWFLAIYCIVVFLFFSASHSKLASYVLPLMPSLAVLLAPRIATQVGAPRRAAWVSAVLFTVLAAGLCIAAWRHGNRVAMEMIGWAALAMAAGMVAAVASSRASTQTGIWVSASLGTILSAQALMMAFSSYPPGQSSKALVTDVRSFITPHTELFSVDQYRQSIPPYLGRTLRLVRYEGELQFGITSENGGRYIPTLDAFSEVWERSADALAFVDLDVLAALKARQLPFELRAADGQGAVITRH